MSKIYMFSKEILRMNLRRLVMLYWILMVRSLNKAEIRQTSWPVLSVCFVSYLVTAQQRKAGKVGRKYRGIYINPFYDTESTLNIFLGCR